MKKTSTLLLLAMALFCSLTAFSIPKLNSFPSASATIYLDFDGQAFEPAFWNGGEAMTMAPSGMTDAQITEAFYRVAEDYRPFNINITTDSTVFLAAPLNKRMRVVITPTSAWCPGVGGIGYVGSFTAGDDIPCFVFSDRLGYSPKMVGECCSHESGHTVGLSHQSKYGSDCNTPTEPYNSGSVASGETGWAPIMGNSYYRNMSNWNNGPTPFGCTDTQDNLSIITSQNGFTYRTDEFPETLNASTYLLSGAFNVSGVITTNSDRDAFRFVLPTNKNIRLNAIPFNVSSNWIGANLDIKLMLYNGSGTLIKTYDPTTIMSVTIDTVLNAGTYYIRIDGTGNTNIGEYGSLGAYTISGSFGALPIHDVKLEGATDKGRHNLAWNIIADEPIKEIGIETSTDGINFKTLTSVGGTANKFGYLPYQESVIYYRLKVTSVINQVVYSNIIALKANAAGDKQFTVSTMVRNEIVVNASRDYQYQLSDLNGRIISMGKGLKGINRLDVFNQAPGMYVIQLISNNEKQTERIIKQ